MSERTRVPTNSDDEEDMAVLTDRKQMWRVTTTVLVDASSENEAIEREAHTGGEIESWTAEPVEPESSRYEASESYWKWCSQFICPVHGRGTPSTVTTKKTCLTCETEDNVQRVLIRSTPLEDA